MTIIIHPSARISPLADIEDSVRGTLLSIGAGSVIDSFVKIKPTGGNGDVIIGDNVVINSGCVLYSGNGIRIGNNVAIAANCTLAPVNHEFSRRDVLIRHQRFQPSRGGILIEDDCWIGSNVVLLDGAILRHGCVIGAMSLVRAEVEQYSIQVGNPLQFKGLRN